MGRAVVWMEEVEFGVIISEMLGNGFVPTGRSGVAILT